MKNRIAVLGANEPLIPFYRQAKQLGYYIVGFATEEGAICKEYCDKFYPLSYKDTDKIIEICRKERIEGITSFSLESALPFAAQIASNLGLVSNSEESINLTGDKYSQRKALEKAGIAVPKYYLINNPDDLFKVNCRFPVIVKPVDSGGSQGICKVSDKDGLLEAYRYSQLFSRTNSVIIEEYVDGKEFSVEYISHNGQHYFLQITDKVTSGAPRFVELQHHQPANIDSSTHQAIRSMVEKALTALKISDSPSHTEIKLNSNNELFIIETGARMGGDYISSDLVRLSTGYDFVDGALKLAIGRFEIPRKKDERHSGVYFFSKLAPEVGSTILDHDNHPEIVQWEYSEDPLMEVQSNADRRGYYIYQK